MKKLIAILLGCVMLFTVVGCKAQDEEANAEVVMLQQQVQQLQSELDALEEEQQNAAPAPTAPPAVEIEKEYVYAFGALIDGAEKVELDGAQSLTAEAVVPEGMALESWSFNGVTAEGETAETFGFAAETTSFVEAKFRPEKTVRTINAQMQFLNKKDKPDGDEFDVFVFEEDYLNPETDQMIPGGTITVYVEAVVPRGYEVDYWLINDVPYHYNRTVTSFTVYDLDESTVYEAVLREETATPKPTETPAPTATPAPTPELLEVIGGGYEPQEQKPVENKPVMYQVTCSNCSFGGKTSGQVPAGTTITVTANGSGSGNFTVNGSAHGGLTKSITITINQDTSVAFSAVIN